MKYWVKAWVNQAGSRDHSSEVVDQRLPIAVKAPQALHMQPFALCQL